MLPNETICCSTMTEEDSSVGQYDERTIYSISDNTTESTIYSDKKKSWPELRDTVNELRKKLTPLSIVAPANIRFRKFADGTVRIFFLGTPLNEWETTLFRVDVSKEVEEAKPDASTSALYWNAVLESCGGLCGKSSKEETLLSERKRLALWGINSFELDEPSGKLVFPASSTLFQCVDNPSQETSIFPTEVRTTAVGTKLCPQICPTNPDLVAYINNNDIWISHMVTGNSHRLTFVHKGGVAAADDPLSAGVPSYVMQEEFDRYLGYWWQPYMDGCKYRILYEETDESLVKLYNVPSCSSGSGEIDQYRYPRAGTANSKSNLKLLEFSLSENMQVTYLKNLELQYPLASMFPWMEYLVRVGWAPNNNKIWLQLLDRRQLRLDLVLLSVENFIEPPPNVYSMDSHLPPTSPPTHIVYTQISDTWINVHDMLYVFPMSKEGEELSFIWADEHTGFRHLYLITSHLSRPQQFIEDFPKGNSCDSSETAIVVSETALTAGEWEVVRVPIWVNADRRLVFFIGLRESPLEKHLYVVSLQQPGEVRLLTEPGFTYIVDFDKDCEVCSMTYSNINQMPACQAFRVKYTDYTVNGVHLVPVGYILEPSVSGLHEPELYSHQIHTGDVLFALLFRPHQFQVGTKYPVVLSVYGGPDVQLVSNAFKGMRHLRMHMLASQGYCVLQIDSRGSRHRGVLFESHLKGKMGTIELSDQVEVLQHLAKSLGFLDMDRVAINGWSYGGYLSIMALAKYPHIFKVAIAGAPVTSWSLYDTGYTERYMDLPQRNLHGYKTGSILHHVGQLPNEENRLLIIHGLIDENVHFHHTSQLINLLVKQCKPYHLQVYPNERHSLRSLDANKHYETTLLSFLQNYL